MMTRRSFVRRGLASAACLTAAGNAAVPGRESARTSPDYSSTGAKLLTDSTPAADGFRFPAEWEPHAGCIMVLPPPQNWKDDDIPLPQVHRQWANIANVLSEFEPVHMVVRPEERTIAKRLLSSAIEVIELPVNDGWSRDSGPMFVVNEEGDRRVAGFTFNGWGGKYPPYSDDALLKARLSRHYDAPLYPIDLVLEGGAVTVDGQGTVITTAECLLHDNRNPGRSREEVERLLNSALGTSRVIWLENGVQPDPITDGHIDGLACFVAPTVVLLLSFQFRNDINTKVSADAKRRLSEARDARGRQLEVIELPYSVRSEADVNFYIGNDSVLVPTTGRRRKNRRALDTLRELFPERKVIGVDCWALAEGGGGIHCITQQIPAHTSIS